MAWSLPVRAVLGALVAAALVGLRVYTMQSVAPPSAWWIEPAVLAAAFVVAWLLTSAFLTSTAMNGALVQQHEPRAHRLRLAAVYVACRVALRTALVAIGAVLAATFALLVASAVPMEAATATWDVVCSEPPIRFAATLAATLALFLAAALGPWGHGVARYAKAQDATARLAAIVSLFDAAVAFALVTSATVTYWRSK